MKVYRGERIRNGNPKRIEPLKKLIRHGYPVDFINEGNPYLLAQLGFFDSAVKHVANDFDFNGQKHRKHFLSFSEKRETARKYAYGSKVTSEYIEEAENNHIYMDMTSTLVGGSFKSVYWDYTEHIITTLDLSGSSPIQEGFDYGHILKYNGGNSKILAINAANYFNLQAERMGKYVTEDVLQSKANSEDDQEWLILILDLIPEQKGLPPSSSGLVTHGDPLSIEFFIDPAYGEQDGPVFM